MEKEQKLSVEDLIDSLFKEATEFAEFNNSEAFAGKQKEAEATHVWDDDAVTDDFSLQLKKELQSNAKKS